MKNIKIILFVLTLGSVLLAQEVKETKVTVYNNNLGVIKEVRDMDIAKGLSEVKITDVAVLIDPTSVHFDLDGTVLEQNYRYDLVGMSKILDKYIDNNIQLINEKGELVEGKLLSAEGNQIVLQTKNGGLTMLPNVDKYRFSVESLPSGLITKPTLVWLVDSKITGKQKVDLSYQTGGMNWSAEYVAVINENDTKLDLNSWVSILNNSGTTFKDAELKLVAGDVNRVNELTGRGNYIKPKYMVEAVDFASRDQFQEKEFFEYHIYKLDRKTTLANNETKQISLFTAKDVAATKKYLYQGNIYGNNKINVVIQFENSDKNNLGKPMPKGKFRLYKSDGESVEFIGEDLIDHTANKETLKLKIGEAFDIVAEEKQSDQKQISDRVSESAWEIKLKNRKKEDVVIDVERILGYNWEVLDSNFKFDKETASKITFKVPVKADSETTLKIRVRYSY